MDWQFYFGDWRIASLYKGAALAKGYNWGSQFPKIEEYRGSGNAWEKPPCHKYQAHLMCEREAVVLSEPTTPTPTGLVTMNIPDYADFRIR